MVVVSYHDGYWAVPVGPELRGGAEQRWALSYIDSHIDAYIERYLVIMPMFREYLFYDVLSSVVLLLVYLFTIQSSLSDDKMTCCTTSQSVFLGFFLWIIFVNETMPFLMLMQRAYTKRM